MTNPFGPAPSQPAPTQQPPSPFAPPAPAQPAAPGYAPPAPTQAPTAPAPYGQPGAPGSSQWPAGATPAPAGTPGGPPAPLAGNFVPVGPPPPASDGAGAKLADMFGRLVILFPQSIQYNLPSKFPNDDGTPKVQNRITACAVVLDDGQGGQQPIAFGGNLTKFPHVPHTNSEALPYVRKGLHIWFGSIIKQIEPWLPGGANAPADGRTPGMVLGRVWKDGPDKTDPWYLRDATQNDVELANYYINGVATGQFPHPLA
jgi:hypothetical protein